MAIRVLIVDDSLFICKRVKEILESIPEGESQQVFVVIGIARNGLEAVNLTALLKPDVITMDIDMPVMDGISAVKQIMKDVPTPILMFSAMTQYGAQATLDALEAGAIDFLPKKLNEIDADLDTAKKLLRRRVRTVALEAGKFKSKEVKKNIVSEEGKKTRVEIMTQRPSSVVPQQERQFNLITIIASTGGPVAIQKVLSRVPETCSIPILIVQHMPNNFTKSFADRLDQLCSIRVKEAQDGDILVSGEALIAPGGKQMEIKGFGKSKSISIRPKLDHELYSPSADITLESVARFFPGALTIVLTGMGSDGKEGSQIMKQAGGSVWAQSKSTCTIYGMPKAVIDAGIADHIFNLDEISHELSRIN